MKTLKEAKRLHDLGFAIHWLHTKSKVPLEAGWTTGSRKPWSYLEKTYRPGLNVGVRLGTASNIGGECLAVMDVDIKSTREHHKTMALATAKKLLNGEQPPMVLSGRGNDSRHYYFLSEPFKTYNAAQSEDKVKVHMPSKKASKAELSTLTKEEIAKGIRLAPAWEISLYSDGRQVVLPPSIHPDTDAPYTWGLGLKDSSDLPILKLAPPQDKTEKPEKTNGRVEPEADFNAVDVDLDWLPISDRIRQGIKTGEGVEDRSAFLLPASVALISAGLTRDEILSVLTDPDTFLGACAYEHAKTTSRRRAAIWVWKYTLKRTMSERSAVEAFKGVAIEPQKKLSKKESETQTQEVEDERGGWQADLERDGNGRYKANFFNCVTILNGVGGTPLVGRNEFAANDYYLQNPPWESAKGKAVVDDDVIRVKAFCVSKFGIEFSDQTINQGLMRVADLNRFHPIRDWLNSLSWDGTSRIDTWLKDYAGAVGPEPYLSDVSRKLLVAMVARVFEPGCKFDQAVILEGNQGTGKSSLLRRLAGNEWFSDAPLVIGDKDAVLTMQSKWLIEVAELSAFNKAEIETFKSFLSQQVDRIRAPYGKRVEEHPRQSVILGTTNNDEYLKDFTGNRRAWPIKTIGKILFNEVGAAREQLFAEALAYYKLGEPLYLENPASETQALLEQAKRLQTDEWLSIVRDIVNLETFPRDCFELREVAKKMDSVGAHKLSPTDVHRVSRSLKLLGFEKFQEPSGLRRKMWRATHDFVRENGTARNHIEPQGAVRESHQWN